MTNICIITPFITKGFRDAGALHQITLTGVKLTNTALTQGLASVECAVDGVLAGPGVVDAAVRAEADGADSIVTDGILDPALEASREAVSLPVIGCGESGLNAAAAFGRFPSSPCCSVRITPFSGWRPVLACQIAWFWSSGLA